MLGQVAKENNLCLNPHFYREVEDIYYSCRKSCRPAIGKESGCLVYFPSKLVR
jgi:hypothetical protein